MKKMKSPRTEETEGRRRRFRNNAYKRDEAIKIQRNRIASLKIDIEESDLKIKKLERKMENREIYSKLDGTIAYIGDPVTGSTSQDAFLKVKSKEGYYVQGQVGELLLDKVKEGTILKCSSYDSERI